MGDARKGALGVIAFSRPWFLLLLLLLIPVLRGLPGAVSGASGGPKRPGGLGGSGLFQAVRGALRRFRPGRRTSRAFRPSEASRASDKPPRRTGPVLRLLGILSAALAAAGPSIRAASDRVEAVFIADVSDSIGPRGAERTLREVNRRLGGMRGEDRAALITVGASPALETPLRPGSTPFTASARHNPSRSALAEALYTAAALFSGSGEKRIVLVSDGRHTEANLLEAVRFARSAGIIVDTLPVGPEHGDDVSVEEVRLPTRISEGEVHEISVRLRASRETAMRLVILRDGRYIGEDRGTLPAGESIRRYAAPPGEPGTRVYEILLEAADDTTPENNRGLGALRVEGAPRILWAGRGNSAVPDALSTQGLIVDRIDPADIPDRIEALSSWDSLILDNVAAGELSSSALALIESWVRTAGGGLMMVGGDSSFGLGGWRGTPVERALPVAMDAPSSLYIPSLAMLMLIDKSGSMGGDVGDGATKLDLVKDAVLSAVEVLSPLYSVGVLAFDADFEWTVPLTEAGNREHIRAELAGLTEGGGTALYPALRAAYNRLVQSPAAVRHLVVLSDGLAEPAEYPQLAEAASRDGITLSTVAVGEDAGRELLEELARNGGGRYWYAETASQVPHIFASESMIVSRGLAVEETVFPVPASPAEALAGIDLSVVPPIHGYVITTPDPAAVEALRAPRGHPILAYGRRGLGRGVVLTTDLRGPWGREWIAWDSLPRILSQSVRWMRRRPGSGDTRLSLIEHPGGVTVRLEARRPGGAFQTELHPAGTVIFPGGSSENFTMHQSAPGRYEGEFSPGDNGVYTVTVTDDDSELLEQTPWTRAYSPEHRFPGIDTPALTEAARLGGGLLLDDTHDGSRWWTVRSPQHQSKANLTIPLGLLSLILLVLEIILREIGTGTRRTAETLGSTRRPAENGESPREKPDSPAAQPRRRGPHAHHPGAKPPRPTPGQAARILAQRRAEREGR